MIAQKIVERIGQPDLIDILVNELSGSELTSLLLEVFNRRTQQLSPTDLLQTYQHNRFVKPADLDAMALRGLEDRALSVFGSFGFSAIELSPVAPLGSCSIVASADQKKIVSATRQTEVVADATNLLALHIADLRKSSRQPIGTLLRFSAIHRHLRTPPVPDLPGMRPHFKIACSVVAGKDTGHYSFEKITLSEHVAMMMAFFKDIMPNNTLLFRLYPHKGYPDPVALVDLLAAYVHDHHPEARIEVSKDDVDNNNYYKGVQCKLYLDLSGQLIDIGDGGFVDWTQQLLQNKKERLFTAGIGIELLHRLRQQP